jgi:hypothetical protein
MTLNLSSRIPFMRQYQISVDAAPCPRERHHGCRHPPPSAHPNLFVERMSEGLIATLRSGLLEIGSMWLYVTLPRKNNYQWRRPLGLRCLSPSEWHWLSVEAKQWPSRDVQGFRITGSQFT